MARTKKPKNPPKTTETSIPNYDPSDEISGAIDIYISLLQNTKKDHCNRNQLTADQLTNM